jgi:sec-independent protein translocase protein TatA
MMMPSGPELIIVVFVILLLFGAKKLPELAQGMGKGIKEFKKATSDEPEVKEVKKDGEE